MTFPSTASAPTGRLVRTALATSAALFLGACAQMNSPAIVTDSMTSTDTTQVSSYGMGQAQQRFSTLTQINKSSVKNLVPVWNTSLDNSASMSTQPWVVDATM